jgi:mannose-6-phosphate isomerase-like protein (cupin superfamily)
MEIHPLDRPNMPTEYGVLVQRLMPWAALNAPFEGAFCVIEPGGATEPHSHHEYEIFLAVSGEGELESEGERAPFMPGDLVHFPPGRRHQLINAGSGDFQFFSVWWDADLASTFGARHETSAAASGQAPS